MPLKLLSIAAAIAILSPLAAAANRWFTTTNESSYQISWGNGTSDPEFAVIDLASGYMRMNPGPTSGWGTSVIVVPGYWSGGKYYQGYPVTVTSKVSGADLVLTLKGTSNNYRVTETITFSPPTTNELTATVSASLTGTMSLDNRPGEAFKPVMLSSMYDSPTSWDSKNVFVGAANHAYPASGWIINPSPAVKNAKFGCNGGTSNWKKNSPTMTIEYSQAIQIAGWLTAETNPNDDNVGFWCAASSAPKTWSYTLVASQGPAPVQP